MRRGGEANIMTNDPWINLAGAIIRGVVDDYMKALKERNAIEAHKCEVWFRGPDFRVYSLGMNPELIISQCRKEAKARKGVMAS